MTPLSSFKRYYYAGLVAALVAATGCTSTNKGCPGCENASFKPNVNLKIVDPGTKQDAFFGTAFKYSPMQLVIKHVEHGVVDSIPAEVRIDSAQHQFNIDLLYKNDVDTLSVQIGTFKPQLVYLSTNILNNCCARVVVTQATYNNIIIFKAPIDPKQQAKMTNLVTIPFQAK